MNVVPISISIIFLYISAYPEIPRSQIIRCDETFYAVKNGQQCLDNKQIVLVNGCGPAELGVCGGPAGALPEECGDVGGEGGGPGGLSALLLQAPEELEEFKFYYSIFSNSHILKGHNECFKKEPYKYSGWHNKKSTSDRGFSEDFGLKTRISKFRD